MRVLGQRWLPGLSCVSLAAMLGLAWTAGGQTILSASTDTTSPNEWTWVGGNNTFLAANEGHSGVYGTMGTAAAGNIPGSRYTAVTWTDKSGNFWLFGGYGYDARGTFGFLNDLWEFNPSTSEWTWMSGSSTSGAAAVYGTLGQFATGNVPGARSSAASWIDSSGNLWLFGGSSSSFWNDLWEFNPATAEWAWMGGSQTAGAAGVYGTEGKGAVGNIPGARAGAVAWADASGNFWLFGGDYLESVTFYLDDLWEYSPSTSAWTWMSGNSAAPFSGSAWAGIYGTEGKAATGNIPGGRAAAVGWIDGSGDLWLMGGWGADANGTLGALNDLWEFEPSTSEWAWMSGSSTLTCPGTVCGSAAVYGTLGVASATSTPGGAGFASNTNGAGATGWTDKNGDFWLLSGDGPLAFTNGIWEFMPASNEWAWMGGSSTGACFGVYGAEGTPAEVNQPGCRLGAAGWTAADGNLWLFGGFGFDNGGFGTYTAALNDLWEYQPSSTPSFATAATPVILPASGNFTTFPSVTMTDATPGAAIYYTTDGTNPDSGSTLYSGAFTVTSPETVKAVGIATNYLNSAVASQAYTLTIPTEPTPTFTPASGTFTSAQSVTISDTDVTATIYYTVNGTAPTTQSAVYSSAIAVGSTETIEAIAVDANAYNSAVASATYTINLPTPSFTISGTAVTVQPGATSGNTSTITLTPVAGFTGSVTLTAALTSSPNGVVSPPLFSFEGSSPVSISGNSAATATLTVLTVESKSACSLADNREQRIPWYAGGGAALACVVFLGMPARRRRWRAMLAMLAVLAVVVGGMTACGGGGGTACTGLSTAGTTPGAYTVTVTGTSGSTTATGTVNLTVQ